jgi:hypothetical protein
MNSLNIEDVKTSKGPSMIGGGSRNDGKNYVSAGGSEAGKKVPDISMQMRSEGGLNTSYLPPINTGGIVANNSLEGSDSRMGLQKDADLNGVAMGELVDPYADKARAINLIDSLNSSERNRGMKSNAQINSAKGRNTAQAIQQVSSEFNSGDVQNISIN